jgi:hypothetical protein
MLSPTGDGKVVLAVNHVPVDQPAIRKGIQVDLDVSNRYVVERPHRSLDQLHVVPAAAVVVTMRPQTDPRQTRTQWQRRHSVGDEEVRLDGADTSHQVTSPE